LYIGTFIGFLIMGTACVSKKKFLEAESTIAQYQRKNTELQEDIKQLKSRLELMEEANNSASSTIDAKDQELQQKSAALQDQEAKLKELQQLIDLQKQKTKALQEKMAKALGNFSSDDLTVFTKNGKVYVSMSEKLLFPSGSAVVNKEGKEALAQIATALNENTDININIEGHTDSIPIKIRFEDNWALSVARSTSILRILTSDYQVDPTRITASGRSQYEPIADNANPEGRAKNRRTEIILAPKLDLLMDLIQTD
jgi:chemotaxis protein MotB